MEGRQTQREGMEFRRQGEERVNGDISLESGHFLGKFSEVGKESCLKFTQEIMSDDIPGLERGEGI